MVRVRLALLLWGFLAGTATAAPPPGQLVPQKQPSARQEAIQVLPPQAGEVQGPGLEAGRAKGRAGPKDGVPGSRGERLKPRPGGEGQRLRPGARARGLRAQESKAQPAPAGRFEAATPKPPAARP